VTAQPPITTMNSIRKTPTTLSGAPIGGDMDHDMADSHPKIAHKAPAAGPLNGPKISHAVTSSP